MTRRRETGLHCLVSIARHHGIELAVERLRHTYAVTDGPIAHALLLRMAREAGLRTRFARLTWDKLADLGQAYPAMACLANGNWVVVTAVGKSAAGEEAIELIDPLAERAEPLVVTKAAFCANWGGEVLLLKRSRVPNDAPRSFGFCSSSSAMSKTTCLGWQAIEGWMACLSV